MTLLQSIGLGALQGITEFLPVSSSGHLLVARHFMGLGDIPLLFDVLMHVPTLLAVAIVFRRRLARLLLSFWRWLQGQRDAEVHEHMRLLTAIIVATLVTGVIGLSLARVLGEDWLPPRVVGAFFIVTAAILVVSRTFRGSRLYPEIGMREGLITGIGQGIGVLPGISRSGITIASALAAGLAREQAGEYAFLVSVPSIVGALALKLPDAGRLAVSVPVLAAGLCASFVFGVLALRLLLTLVRSGRLHLFAFYLVPLGVAVLALA
jgi:undecaprenyl-diphosphatase